MQNFPPVFHLAAPLKCTKNPNAGVTRICRASSQIHFAVSAPILARTVSQGSIESLLGGQDPLTALASRAVVHYFVGENIAIDTEETRASSALVSSALAHPICRTRCDSSIVQTRFGLGIFFERAAERHLSLSFTGGR